MEADPQYPWDHTLNALKMFINLRPYVFNPAPLSNPSDPSSSPLLDTQPHPEGSFSGTFHLPLWYKYEAFDASCSHYLDSQLLLNCLEPMFWTLNAQFQRTNPTAYLAAYSQWCTRREHGSGKYIHQEVRGNRCFESMRINVNLALEPAVLRNELHGASWVVLQTFGRFSGGELVVRDRDENEEGGGEEEVHVRTALKPGEWFVIEGDKELGSLPFRGERIQLELFTPWCGEEEYRMDIVQPANDWSKPVSEGEPVNDRSRSVSEGEPANVQRNPFSGEKGRTESGDSNAPEMEVTDRNPTTPNLSVQNPRTPPNPCTPPNPISPVRTISDGDSGDGEGWESAKSRQSDQEMDEDRMEEENN